MRTLYTSFILSILFFYLEPLQAQGWEYDYTNPPSNPGNSAGVVESIELSDGNFLVRLSGNKPKICKISALGDLLAYDDSLSAHYLAPQKIYPLPDGEALIVGCWVSGQYFRVRIDREFHFHWLGTFNAVYGDFQRLPDGGLLTFGPAGGGTQLKAIRLGPNLDTIWTQSMVFPAPGVIDPKAFPVIFPQADGSSIIYIRRTGYVWPNTVSLDQIIVRLGPDGNVLSSQVSFPFNEPGFPSVRFDEEGHYFRWGGATVRKYDLAGTLIWEKPSELIFYSPSAQTTDIAFAANGFLNVIGYSPSGAQNLLFCRLTPNGDLVWSRTFGLPNIVEAGYSMLKTQDGGFLLGGARNSSAYLVRTDSLGQKTPRILHGKIFRDENENCLQDAGELPYSQIMLQTLTWPPFYCNPDAAGNFSFSMPFKEQKLAVKSLNPFWTPCQDTIEINLQSPSSDTILIPVKQTTDCPLLRIGLAANVLKPCSAGFYTLDYCNDGTVTATAPEVLFSLNDSLQFDSASISPVSVIGKQFRFVLPDLAPGVCGSIKIWFTVPCTVNIGDYLCSAAAIKPNVLCVPPETLGYGNDLPFDDRDCRSVVATEVPNEKITQPPGTGPTHLISRDSTLHYLIRFQNTGADTAFTAVVHDSLYRWLDPASFRVEVSSAPVAVSVRGLGVVDIRFLNGILPAGSVNEPASHGFVKFSARVRPEVPALTRVRNTASVYLDADDPVQTNTVFHTIDRVWATTPQDTGVCVGTSFWGHVIQHDTVMVDTFTFTENYLIVTAQVTALPVYKFNFDTVVNIGETVGNHIINAAHQTVKEILTTIDGCDSLITWQVTGVVGTSAPPSVRQLRPQPNPAADWLALPLPFSVGEIGLVQLGTAGGQLVDMPYQSMGEQSLRLDVQALLPGWYFGRLWRGDRWYVFRFIKS